MAAAWKNFKTAVKEKRTGKKGGRVSHDILAREEVVIQRLSAKCQAKLRSIHVLGRESLYHMTTRR